MIGTTNPNRAEFASEYCGGLVAGPGKRIYCATLVNCRLRDKVRGGTEAVDANLFGFAGQTQASVTNQAAS